MKKIVRKILFGCFIFSCFISVKAETYAVNTLFPIDTEATVETNSFTYQNMSFSSNLDDKGNATIYFQQIINRTDQKIPVSINVLLFNNDKKNIGFVTYCTNNDYDSSYNRFELDAKQAVPFTISVTPRYLAIDSYEENGVAKEKKYSASEVKYLAVYDDNAYCRLGGYNRFKGKTIEEITGGSAKSDNSGFINKFMIENSEIIQKVIFVVVSLIILGIVIFILKSIYQAIFSKRSPRFTQFSGNNDVSGENQEVQNPKAEEALDLSYGGKDIASEKETSDDLLLISKGESNNNLESNDSQKDDNNGESDLSNFFK